MRVVEAPGQLRDDGSTVAAGQRLVNAVWPLLKCER
jgi:hypothetical protein